jgi:hypothetical protein
MIFISILLGLAFGLHIHSAYYGDSVFVRLHISMTYTFLLAGSMDSMRVWIFALLQIVRHRGDIVSFTYNTTQPAPSSLFYCSYLHVSLLLSCIGPWLDIHPYATYCI